MSERSRGDKWAEVMRARGCWVQKLSTSDFSGLPDWLLVHPTFGNCFMEAKKLQEKGSAFVPSQCTRAQRFFLEAVARHQGQAYILVLGPVNWCMARVREEVKVMTRKEFRAMAESYPRGWKE